MMRRTRSKRWLTLAGTLVAAAVVGVGIAVAASVVVTDTNNVRLRIVASDFAAGEPFDSGWHTHPGLAIVQVQEGSLFLAAGNCRPKTLGPGDTYIEVPGVPVRAIANGRAKWTTTFILSNRVGDPGQTPAAPPC
jgi:quercetin dioxygenase-like cupin family protein